MKVFLTGGTGYLGGRIARSLLDAGHGVRALVRDQARGASLVGCGAETVLGDLLEPDSWSESLAGCDGIVHAAGLVNSWGPDPLDFDRVNLASTLEILDQGRRHGIERIVVTSSLFALGPSAEGVPVTEAVLDEAPHPVCCANDYVRTKTAMTRAVWARQRGGDPAVQVFPTILLGPGALTRGNHTAGILSDIGRGRFPGLVGDGEQKWNLVGVDDAARGHVLALEKGRPGGCYALGGEDWTQRELVTRAAGLFGRKPPLRRLGIALPLTVAMVAEAWARLSGRPPILTRGEARLYNHHWAVSSLRARAELDYVPESVQKVLEDTVAWLRDEIWKR